MGMEGGSEEEQQQHCNLIYYCSDLEQDDIDTTFPKNARPTHSNASQHTAEKNKSLEVIYDDVRILLDEDRGGFNEGEFGVMRHGRFWS